MYYKCNPGVLMVFGQKIFIYRVIQSMSSTPYSPGTRLDRALRRKKTFNKTKAFNIALYFIKNMESYLSARQYDITRQKENMLF
jgi:hypothetical protein